jgi:hypothetical protein
MTPNKSFIIASAAILLLVVPATAQTPGQRIVVEQMSAAQRQEGNVRVQSNINFFIAGATGDNEDAQKTREKAQRSVYEMAARQCELLREVLAKDCRMESITSNVGRQFSQQQQEGYTVNGSMTFQITLK